MEIAREMKKKWLEKFGYELNLDMVWDFDILIDAIIVDYRNVPMKGIDLIIDRELDVWQYWAGDFNRIGMYENQELLKVIYNE